MKIYLALPILLLTMKTPAQSQSNQMPPRLTLAETLAKLPGPNGERYTTRMTHGTLEVLLYAPRGKDDQKPHQKDEVYIVMTGTGKFFNGKDTMPFGPGDVLFVPAKAEHRFSDFSDDFAAWVVFYGPPGGEK